MKKIFLVIIFGILTFSGFIFLPKFVYAADSTPIISSITPVTLHYYDEAEIIGTGFGNDRTRGGVDWAGTGAGSYSLAVDSWTDTKISIRINQEFPGNPYGSHGIIVRTDNANGGNNYSNSFIVNVEKSLCDPKNWSCGTWSACTAAGQQTRSCNKALICEGSITSPLTIQNCTYTPPACTFSDWQCDAWNECSVNGLQTRKCDLKYGDKNSSSPVCQGGVASPPTTQSCTYIPPAPTCNADTWTCGGWNACSIYGLQTRNCSKVFDCSTVNTQSPLTSQSCTPPSVYQLPPPSCNSDTWTCGDWNTCSLSGIQNRSCRKTFDCSSVETAPPTTDQYCEVPNRPTQQVPQNSVDEISNQDIIIKSTVKLLCPVDTQRASQGSGTVIDSNGTILTNKHVIAGTLGCLVGFINDFNDEPYFGERHIADIVKISPNQDIAILKIRNPQNRKLTYVDINRGYGNLRLGTQIMTYGYPARFGDNLTYTSGDFSGKEGVYLKTTAILEYGNSGGGAYLKDGTYIGIPSAVKDGKLNSLGLILSLNTIKAWMGNYSVATGPTNNNYSRVAALEDIDLKKLGSLKLFIPNANTKSVVIPPTTNKNTQKIKEQPKIKPTQKESTIIEPINTDQKINPELNNSKPLEPVKKVKWYKKVFNWFK